MGKGDEFGGGRRGDRGRGEGEQDGAEEGYAFYKAGMGVGAREDGLEDAGEVERIEGRGERRGDDCTSGGEVFLGGVELASLYTVDLEVHPPHPRETQHKP